MDYLQMDMTVVIEQKSGKGGFPYISRVSSFYSRDGIRRKSAITACAFWTPIRNSTRKRRRSSGIRKLREEGCEFRSHVDGSKHFFTPENVMDTQRVIGADIIMAFDECPPGQSDFQYAKKSLMLTQRWLDRCFKRFNETSPLYGHQQSLFPIVQGCTFKELRRDAAKYVADKGADGNAIGGLAVGEPTEVMYEMIETVNEILPKDKPRYLMVCVLS